MLSNSLGDGGWKYRRWDGLLAPPPRGPPVPSLLTQPQHMDGRVQAEANPERRGESTRPHPDLQSNPRGESHLQCRQLRSVERRMLVIPLVVVLPGFFEMIDDFACHSEFRPRIRGTASLKFYHNVENRTFLF